MSLKKLLLSSSLLLGTTLSLTAQTFVPPNMDFEAGTTANWTYYVGTVAADHIFSLTATSPVPTLHTIMSGSGTDAFGLFPVVGHGLYSLKLAKDTVNNNADAATYNVHVPSGGSYSLIYHYAAVLQDAAHLPNIQPVLKVTATDSATGVVLSDSLELVPTSAGFTLATTGTDVKYKSWTTESTDLTGYGGHTVTFKFAVAGCGTGGHFGYGYIDVSSCFRTSFIAPSSTTPVALIAPPCYSAYRWTDPATYLAAHGTTATITVPSPTTTTTYAVIATPAAGHGIVDTFYTTVYSSTTLGMGSATAGSRAFNIYPNPASAELNIQWAEQQTGTTQVELADVTGRIVSKSQININAPAGTTRIDMSKLNNGTYFVTIRSATASYCSQVILQK